MTAADIKAASDHLRDVGTLPDTYARPLLAEVVRLRGTLINIDVCPDCGKCLGDEWRCLGCKVDHEGEWRAWSKADGDTANGGATADGV